MKPSEQCKAAGLKNLKELSTIAKVSSETLVNWSKNRPDVFRLLIAGVVAEKKIGKIDWQQKCLSVGFEYWRAPDSHGVICTQDQAIELLQELLCVEVEITNATK